MKRLLLLRHAKANPDRRSLPDEDRTLTERGRADSVRMGQFLHQEVYLPDLVLCSPAVRTRQTLDLVLPEIETAPAVLYLHELYLAKASQIVEMVRESRNAAATLLVVGHNPGLEECARTLAREPDEHLRRKQYRLMTEKFPTAALAVIDFDTAEWQAAGPGLGELELFVRPKDLHEEEG